MVATLSGGKYFTGWPSYVIDSAAVANRIMPWMSWKYRIDGELYYSMVEAYSHDNDPLKDVFLHGGNGDGTLFYPGRPGTIGGTTQIPLESIRLKLIREGLEDYEYFVLLSNLTDSATADRWVPTGLCRTPIHSIPLLRICTASGKRWEKRSSAGSKKSDRSRREERLNQPPFASSIGKPMLRALKILGPHFKEIRAMWNQLMQGI